MPVETGIWMDDDLNLQDCDPGDDDLDGGGLVDGNGNPLSSSQRSETAEEKAARYRARPDAGDVQQEARRSSIRAPKKGLKCPKCRCQNFEVLDTRSGDDSKVRRRQCRACGYIFRTGEVVTSDLPQNTMMDDVIKKLFG